MFDSHPSESSRSESDHEYKLPPVEDFDGVNQNFHTLSGIVRVMASSMEKHAETTNNNLTRMAEETSVNLTKMSNEIKTVLNSQVMVLTICIIAIGFLAFFIKGIIDLANMIW